MLLLPILATPGSKALPLTPGPDQVPGTLGLVVKEIAGSVLQKGPVGLVRVMASAGFTVTVTSAVLAHSPGLGVKVSVWGPGPASGASGSKVLPVTPGPDQVPSIRLPEG